MFAIGINGIKNTSNCPEKLPGHPHPNTITSNSMGPREVKAAEALAAEALAAAALRCH